MKKLLMPYLLFILLLATPVMATEMSIKQAYVALGHKQKTFDARQTTLSPQEAKYLDHIFYATDLAFRERMVMLKYFRQDKSASYIETYNKEINNVLVGFSLMNPPNKKLKKVENIIIEAVRDQQKFFNQLHALTPSDRKALLNSLARDRLVQSSHQKLISAYSLLIQNYPNESQHNRQAFYEHLCALDFI